MFSSRLFLISLKFLAATLVFLPISYASEYGFDWDSEEDMKGAYFICTPTGYTLGDCPDVFKKCWKPPLIKIERKGWKVKITSKCLGIPSFSMSKEDTKKAIGVGAQRAGESPSQVISEDVINIEHGKHAQVIDGQAANNTFYQPQEYGHLVCDSDGDCYNPEEIVRIEKCTTTMTGDICVTESVNLATALQLERDSKNCLRSLEDNCPTYRIL